MSSQVLIARWKEIDGIRGWCALSVLLCHMILTPFSYFVSWLNMSGFLLINGIFAVKIFFILSGDALSSGFFATNDCRLIDRLVLKRYFRLTMPSLVSCFVLYGVIACGWDFHMQAAIITHAQRLKLYLTQVPDFDSMLLFSLIRIYTDYSFNNDDSFFNALPTTYNPTLWTLAVELHGSILVFLFLYIFPRLKYQREFLLGLFAFMFLFFTLYSGFFFGILLGYYRSTGQLNVWRHSRAWQIISSLIIILFIVGSVIINDAAAYGFAGILALLFVFVCYTNQWALGFFRARFSQFLGRLSFSLYVIHFPILVSLTSFLIVWTNDRGGITPFTITAIVLVSVIVSFAAAYLLYRIETPYLRGLDYAAREMLSKDAKN